MPDFSGLLVLVLVLALVILALVGVSLGVLGLVRALVGTRRSRAIAGWLGIGAAGRVRCSLLGWGRRRATADRQDRPCQSKTEEFPHSSPILSTTTHDV